MNPAIKNFFYPSSICIPGASVKEKSIGYEILRSILNYGYKGKIYPVNPKSDKILGIKCFPRVSELPECVDLAVVVVPKLYAEETIDELLSIGVKSIILITAGFKEVGEKGAEAEKNILRKIKNAGAELVGPNCMGVINTLEGIKLNATFVAERPETGSTAFLSQSGAIGAAVLNSLRETGIRFSHFISVGNKADISENDLLEFWDQDRSIETITMYLESFENGEEFLLLHDEMKIEKPVIILKAGRTQGGIKAASSHTGAMGTNSKITDALLDQFGIISVRTLNELFNTSKGFEDFPRPRGNRIAVVTNAGGPAILAVDSLENCGLKLAGLSEKTKNKLKTIVVPEGSVQNPIDLLPGATAGQYMSVINILKEDENTDAIISIFVEPIMVEAYEVIETINSIDSGIPVMQVVMPLPEFWEKYKKTSKYMKPLFRNPEEPAVVISNILFHSNKRKRTGVLKPNYLMNYVIRKNGLLDHKTISMMAEEYQIPAVKTIICSKEEIKEAAIKIGYPVVLKGISAKVIHKSDINAVITGINNGSELTGALAKIESGFSEYNLSADEFMVQQCVKATHEILIGGLRDKSFGPVIMFGTGGKYVEVTDDIRIKSAYLCEEDIEDIILKTKIGQILMGVRGEKPVDLNPLKYLIRSSAQMLLDHKEISEFDLNPVIISDNNTIHAVDIRIKAF